MDENPRIDTSLAASHSDQDRAGDPWATVRSLDQLVVGDLPGRAESSVDMERASNQKPGGWLRLPDIAPRRSFDFWYSRSGAVLAGCEIRLALPYCGNPEQYSARLAILEEELRRTLSRMEDWERPAEARFRFIPKTVGYDR